MYCKNCNQSFSDEHVFCNNCGGKLENDDTAEGVQSAETTSVDAPVVEVDSAPQPSQEPVDQEPEVKPQAQVVIEPVAKQEPVMEAQPVIEPQPQPVKQSTGGISYGTNVMQPSEPVAVQSEPVINKKESRTVPFLAWLALIFLNIVPFVVGVVSTVAIIVVPFLLLDYINPIWLIIPGLALIYIILLFIWAFAKPKARSLKNYSRATLLMGVIVLVLFLVAYLVFKDYIYDSYEYIMEMFEDVLSIEF